MRRPTALTAALIALLLTFGAPARAYDAADFQRDELAMDALFVKGDYPGAEAAARALALQAQALFGPDSPQALRSDTAVANSITRLGRVTEALAIHQDVYDRAMRSLSKYHPQTLKAAMALADGFAMTGQPERGLPLAIETVRFVEGISPPDDPTLAQWRYNLAGLYYDLGYPVEARGVYVASLAVLNARPDPATLRTRATITRQIARTDARLLEPAAAVAGYQDALPLFEAFYGPDHPETAITRTEYIRQLWRARQRDDLPTQIAAARRAASAAFGPDSPYVADTMEVEALVLTAGGPGAAGFRDGLALLRQALTMKEATLSPNNSALGFARLDLAAMLTDTGEPADMREALILMAAAEASGTQSRRFFYDTWMQAADMGAVTRREAMAGRLGIAQRSQGSAAAVAMRKYATRLAMGEGEAARSYRVANDLVEREARLQAQLVSVASRPLVERDRTAEAAMRDELTRLRPEIDRNQALVSAEIPSLADLNGNGVLSLDALQDMLAEGEAVVILDTTAREGDGQYAFAISRDDFTWARLEWTSNSFVSAVADVRAGIGLRLGTRAAAALGDAPPPVEFDSWAAEWIYQETLGQLRGVIAGKAHLYLDLRGPLAALPPALMVTQAADDGDYRKARWLIEDHALTVIPSVFSLRTVALARARARAPEPYLAFADPVFDLDAGTALVASLDGTGMGLLRGALAPLPETADEVREVAASLQASPAALRLGAAASEAAFKETRLADFRVLHFATHGLVTGDVAGETVLGEPALALTPGRGQDGFLMVSEILELDLNADWVVLSACNTAVGNDPDAEALSGLAQAFFYAGARSLLVSHWPVESRSAAHLMTETFRLRASAPELSAAEVQRRVMLDMARGGRWDHPAFWAPFVLVGDPD